MDYKLYLISFPEEPDVYLKYWHSGNPALADGCDACIGYSVFDANTLGEVDGGEMDYDSSQYNYDDLENAKDGLIDFIWDGKEPASVQESDMDPDLFWGD